MKRLLLTTGLGLGIVALVISVYTGLAWAQSQAKCYIQAGAAAVVAASGCTYDFQSGSTLEVDSGATFTVGGYTQSGAVRFGAQTAATDGITITHGFATTPTSVVLSPQWTASTVTQTVYVSNVGASTFSIEFTDGTVTNTTVYWLAGK